MSINGFYGGRQGQNFYISKVFENFTSLKADIADKYNSNIGFGEYVMINYGAPTGYGFTCKVEEQTGTNPDTYKETTKLAVNFKADGLIGLRNSMTGDTEVHIIKYDGNSFTTNPLSKYADLRITEHCGVITFKITCTFTDESIKNLAIDKETGFGYNYNNTLWKKISGSEKDTTGIKIQYFDTEEDINANSVGYELITYLGGNIPTITVNTKAIDADLEPSVSYSQPTIDNPHFTFNLPHRQVFVNDVEYVEYTPTRETAPITKVVYESENKQVDINNPQLKIHLPRDVKFWSNDENIDKEIESQFEEGGTWDSNFSITSYNTDNDYGINDYYIHNATAYIYQIKMPENTSSLEFTYKGKLVQRAPDNTITTTKTTFEEQEDGSIMLRPFKLNSIIDNNHSWQLEFIAPKPVGFNSPVVTEDPLLPTEDPTVSMAIVDDNYTLTFGLPRASVWSHGEGGPTHSQTAGDYYLDTKEGKVYSVNKEIANLTGPQGPAGASYFLQNTLKVKVDAIGKITINDKEPEITLVGDTITEKIANYITSIYSPTDTNFNGKAPMLMVEVVEYDEQNEIGSFISYNYYVADEKWRYVQISGQASAIETEITNITFMFDGGTLSDEVGV